MEKKLYIKPSVMAHEITPPRILAGSDFGSGGSGDPSGGRAKLFDFEVSDGDSDE